MKRHGGGVRTGTSSQSADGKRMLKIKTVVEYPDLICLRSFLLQLLLSLLCQVCPTPLLPGLTHQNSHAWGELELHESALHSSGSRDGAGHKRRQSQPNCSFLSPKHSVYAVKCHIVSYTTCIFPPQNKLLKIAVCIYMREIQQRAVSDLPGEKQY